jgi:hypothetical protein
MPQYEIEIKICNLCDKIKSIDNFNKRKTSKDGYRSECKNCDSERKKIYYIRNKYKMSIKNKKWRTNNTDKIKENINNFYVLNPNYRSEYQKNSKNKINKRLKNRRENDEYYRIKENTRNLIKNSIKKSRFNKQSKTIDILGCDYIQFKQHLENKFAYWMNWDNYGNPKDKKFELNKTWDIDHIIPLSSANTIDELIKLNHYTNLQPLCSYVNRFVKKNKNENA